MIQGAEVCVVDIVKTEKFSVQEVINGVYNAFNYDTGLKAMCIEIEGNEYKIITREYYLRGAYINEIKKWLE